MTELHACHIRVTRLYGALGLAFLTLLAACQSEVFGTLSPVGVETEQGTLRPDEPGTAVGTSGDSAHVNEGPPAVETLAPPPDGTLRTCANIPVASNSPVVSADMLPGRTLPSVQTHITETISLQRIFEKLDRKSTRL